MKRAKNLTKTKTSIQMLRGIVPTILVLCALALTITLSAQDYKNEKQLIKNAEAAFNAGNYTDAMPLYSNLVSKYNKDPNFNYRYGACLLFAGADKEKPLKYLSFAASRPDVDVEAHYYLGLAQHLNYHFSEAIKSYEKFKATAKPELVKSLSVENRIAQCRNGKSLLSNITDLIVLDKQSLAEADFYKMYDLSEFGGQILSKPEDLQTAYEKKAGIESILFLPKGRDTLYFSGVEAEGKSRDIFMAIRKPDGTWSAPQTLGKTINSEYDEDYAFFHPDEQRLYFASKGHNSLGGYDVFTAKYNPASGTWGAPVNLDFAICTPADDYMLITDKSGTKAFFASNRESPAGMVNVYRINLQRIPLDFALIYGTFTAETTKKAVIKVENAETGEKIGEFLSDETGKYKLRVPNNGKFRLLVDYQNSSITHSGELELRNRSSFKPLKQEMLVMHQGTDNETLVIKNLFDEEVADVEPVITPDFLKEKARLEINEDKFKDLKPELIVQESATPTSKEQAKPEEAQGPVMESGGEQGTVAKTEEPVDDRPILAEQPEVAAKSTSAPPTVTETSQVPKSSPKTSATTSTSPRQSASSGLKLKVGANPTNAEIAEVAVNNITALNNDAAILLRESEVAAAIAAEKSESAKTTRAKAAQLLAGMDTNSAEVKNNAQYKEARELERQAAFIDKEAATAARLADNLKESAAEAETSHKLAEEYAMGITNNQNGAIEDNIKRYNQLSDYVDSRLSKEIRLSDMREDAQQRYAAKTAESSDLRQSADEINDKITGLERNLLAKEGALMDARGQARKTLEQQIAQDRATIDAERIRLNASLRKAEQTEAEAQFIEHEVAVINEILAVGEDDALIAEKLATSNIGATVYPKENEVVAPAELPQKSSEAAAPNIVPPPLTTDQPVAVKSTTTVTEEGVQASNNQAKSRGSLPVLPEVEMATLEPDAITLENELMWDEDQLEEQEKSLLPMKPNIAELTPGFIPQDVAASLAMPDQSVRSVMYEGYHRDYMNKYGEIAEEPDALTRTAQTYVVNENWLTDIAREKKYLESLKGNAEVDQTLLQTRLNSLEELADLKRTAMLRNRSQLAMAAVDTPSAQNVMDKVRAYRIQIGQSEVEEEVEVIAQNKDVNSAGTSVATNSSSSDISEGSAAVPDVQALVNEGSDDATPMPSPSQAPQPTAKVASTESSGTDAASAQSQPQTNQEKTSAKTSADTPIFIPESEAMSSVSAIEEINTEEGFVSDLRPLPDVVPAAVSQAIIEEKEVIIEGEKANSASTMSQLKEEADAATTAAAIAKKRDREEAERRAHASRKAVEMAKEEQKFQDYRLAQLRKSADAAAFGLEPSELPSTLEAQRAETLKESAVQARSEATAASAEKPPRNKKKRKAYNENVYAKDMEAAKAEQAANSSIKLVEELRRMEEQISSAKAAAPKMLNTSTTALTPEETQNLPGDPVYKQYDSLRTASDRYFKDAKMIEVRSKETVSEIEGIDKSIAQGEALLAQTDDDARKSSLEREMAMMKSRRASFVSRQEKMADNSEALMASANLLRNQALTALETAPDDKREKLNTLALADEVAGRYAYSALTDAQRQTAEAALSKESFSSILRGDTEIPGQLQEAVFEMMEFNTSLYNSSNPIPLDTKLPEGLVFKVQIGAFRNPPPQDIFKGFAPVRGESTRPGWIRYTAGLFSKKEQAQLKRNELRTLGYADAFVVAYLNGQRISMAEADDLLASGGQSTVSISSTSVSSATGEVAKVEGIKGVLYTVQVGAFSRPAGSAQLYNLSPLVEYQANGLFKYGSGVYSNAAAAAAAKQDLVSRVGVKDAFVTAFVDGRKISIEEADRLVAAGTPVAGTLPATTAAIPLGDIAFSVQLGAYRGEVPVEDAKSILVFTNLGIDIREESGLTIYTVGQYKNYQEALQMAERVKNEGLQGAFVVAYSGNRKMDLQQAINLTK